MRRYYSTYSNYLTFTTICVQVHIPHNITVRQYASFTISLVKFEGNSYIYFIFVNIYYFYSQWSYTVKTNNGIFIKFLKIIGINNK
jgi:hypothetical protein